MKDELQKEIDIINENLNILPKKNKDSKKKYIEYLNDNIEKFEKLLFEVKEELNNRKNSIIKKYSDNYNFKEINIDYSKLKKLDSEISSYEKMNLSYYFYKLQHFYKNNLDEVNEVILSIIEEFKNVGITITSKDFKYSKTCELYIETLLNKKNINDLFNNIYWESFDIIKQIELNFRSIYNLNKSRIDKYFINYCKDNDLNKIIESYRQEHNYNNNIMHNNKKYLFDLFIEKKFFVSDFIEKNMSSLLEILSNDDEKKNYNNLLELRLSLYEYRDYLSFEFMINSFKELYNKKDEYKGLFETNMKEIEKKEGLLFKNNIKINKSGLFKPNNKKKEDLKLECKNIISELDNLYKENDILKIKKEVLDNKENYNCFKALKLILCNYNYFTSLLKENNNEIEFDEIEALYKKLNKYIYLYQNNIISNIDINNEVNIPRIIADKYLLNDINVKEENLDKDSIEKYISDIEKLVLYFDLKNNEINLDDIRDYINIQNKLD